MGSNPGCCLKFFRVFQPVGRWFDPFLRHTFFAIRVSRKISRCLAGVSFNISYLSSTCNLRLCHTPLFNLRLCHTPMFFSTFKNVSSVYAHCYIFVTKQDHGSCNFFTKKVHFPKKRATLACEAINFVSVTIRSMCVHKRVK